MLAFPLGPLEQFPRLNFAGKAEDRERAVSCLALAAWYEAGNAAEAQESVMQVVLNRVRHPSFPKTVCGVVFQGSERSTGCQFTFTCDGSLRSRTPSRLAWDQARRRAEAVLDGGVVDLVSEATHYHANYVVPWWSAKLKRLTQVGAHIFYRWPGARGALAGAPNLARETTQISFETLGRARAGPAAAPANAASLAIGPLPAAGISGLTDAPASQAVGESVTTSAHFLTVDAGQPSGRWALAAMSECAGKADCQVLAYPSGEEVASNRRLAADRRARPLFVYVRDGASGIAVSLWDCGRVQRPDTRQCLPDNGPALRKLMRERSG